MFYTDVWALGPGIQQIVETWEAQVRWGPAGLSKIRGGSLNANASDPTNNPTYELRPGLLLGQRAADGTWMNYNPTATDGSQVASGVLLVGIRMQMILTGQNLPRFYGIMVGGCVKAATLIGLDMWARATMSDQFQFDDDGHLQGNHWYPWGNYQTKTANYQAVVLDNFTQFDNLGATGEVDITLPPIQNGLYFSFKANAAQILKAISNEGGNLVGTTLTQNSVSVNAIGGGFEIYSNPAGTKWLVQNDSSGTQTLTFA